MKFSFFNSTIGICITIVILSSSTRAQDFYNVNKTFKKFDMEFLHRGTFNMSYCSRELLNCWELVKPDIICAGLYYFESICGVTRQYCLDVTGDSDAYHYYNHMDIQEGYCEYNYYNYGYTRRRNTERNFTDIMAKISVMIRRNLNRTDEIESRNSSVPMTVRRANIEKNVTAIMAKLSTMYRRQAEGMYDITEPTNSSSPTNRLRRKRSLRSWFRGRRYAITKLRNLEKQLLASW